MTEKKKQSMLDKAKRLYDDIDKQLQKECAIEWFGKNAVSLSNARAILECVIVCLDKLETTEIKENAKSDN